MKDDRKTKKQLISELTELRQRIAELEASEAERKQAEEALQESEARYRTLFDGVPVGLYRTSPDGQILDVNLALLEMLGFPDRETALAVNAADGYANPEDRTRWQALIEREGVVRDFEAQWRRRDGMIIWVKDTARTVRDADGRVLYYEGALEDITERKRAEEALRKAHDELERKVEERTAELTRTNEELQIEIAERKQAEEALRQYTAELEARNAELDAFARTVAHDLKTPLRHMVGYAQVLEKNYAAPLDEDARSLLQEIVQSGLGMGHIIDGLLLLAIVRKVEEVEMETLDMSPIVAKAQGRLARVIEEHQAEIILPDTWPVALGYGPWVEEVWANYLDNAIKYGGRPPRVELGATAQADGQVRFWVRDNGPGISPKDQARLFTPFERLDQVRAEGHGLGLSIVWRIVERIGGQVGVESEVDQGSVFTFTLPGIAS